MGPFKFGAFGGYEVFRRLSPAPALAGRISATVPPPSLAGAVGRTLGALRARVGKLAENLSLKQISCCGPLGLYKAWILTR